MSTRARIILEAENKNYYSIYLHYDGYISGAGKTLNTYYKDKEKLRKLISLGDLSALGETLEDTISYFGWRLENCLRVITYKEDFKTFISDIVENGWEEYIYLFKETENKWYVYNIYKNNCVYDCKNWEDLEELLKD